MSSGFKAGPVISLPALCPLWLILIQVVGLIGR